VRAQVGASCPFLWQAYPQADGAHALKLEAFLDRFLAGAAPDDAAAVRQAFRGFNGLAPLPTTWPEPAAWLAIHRAWRERLLAQDDLCTQLLRFVDARLR
jgi:hypothetical protein